MESEPGAYVNTKTAPTVDAKTRAAGPDNTYLRTSIGHRVDRDTLELSMTIDDPKVYTRPWVALDQLRFKLQPPNTDIREMLCSPSEIAAYNRKHAAPDAGK